MSLQNFTLIVQTLSAVASIIAIFSVLYAWKKSIAKPLKILFVDIFNQESDTANYRVAIKNQMTYPIEIQRVTIYQKRKYSILFNGIDSEPSWTDSFSSNDICVEGKVNIETDSTGWADAELVNGRFANKDFSKTVYVCLDTPHGFYFYKTKKIKIHNNWTDPPNVGEEVYNDKINALFAYWKHKLKYQLVNRIKKGI